MRQIQPHERPLVDALFAHAGLASPTASTLVEEMDDGGMGSLAFLPRGRPTGGTISECQFTDADGVLVFAALNIDADGHPLEIDLWKIDFDRLRAWPKQEQLTRFSSERALGRH